MGKVIHDLLFRERFFILLEAFKKFIKISCVGVLHDDAKFVFSGVVYLFELDDVLMPDHVMKLCF